MNDILGRRLARIEDGALLTGRACFVDDIRLPDLVEAAFVRSPFAHARITGIDAEAARAMEGVHAVYTHADVATSLRSDRLPILYSQEGCRPGPITPFVLAKDEVCYVGEAVAVVIADSRYIAEDAVAQVEVAYEPLPTVADCRAALATSASTVHADASTNVISSFVEEYGDVAEAFARAAHVVGLSLKQHRGCVHSIECRGLVARPDPIEGRISVWTSTQMAHEVRGHLMSLFGCDENQLRVVAPEVGGGFGGKFLLYPEEVVITAAAKLLDRPVKWIEDRREHFLATIQERDQHWDVEIAVDARGLILGLRGRMIHDQGAYTPTGRNLAYTSATSVPGPYVVPNYRLEVFLAETNKVPTMTIRGAGYPEATFTMERLMDAVAHRLGLDRGEVRRRNLITPERMPYSKPLYTRAGTPITYDGGDFPRSQARALEAIDYPGFADRQGRARTEGRYLGIGFANAVKGTGRGPFESGLVRIGRSGRVSVYTGAMPMGQGVKTALAMIVAEQIGVSADQVAVIAGDTAAVPLGLGGYASRQTVTAGSSVYLAARAVREKVLKVASRVLESAVEDLELAGGEVHVIGTDVSVGLAEIAKVTSGVAPGYPMIEGVDPGLEASHNFMTAELTYAHAAHAVEVEVDVETGAVHIVRYVVVNDSGRLINPMIVEGQIQGGAVHGIGNALFEWMGYDDSANPITTNLGEYLLPTAPEVPEIEIIHYQTPSRLNPLGVKGVGEVGVIPVAAAVIAAVESALEPFGVRIDETPILPARIIELIGGARRA